MVQEPAGGVAWVRVRLQVIPLLLRSGEGDFIRRDDGDAAFQALGVGFLDQIPGGRVVDQDRVAGTVGEPMGDKVRVEVSAGGGREVVAPVVERDGGGGGVGGVDGFGGGDDEDDVETRLGGEESGELGEKMGSHAANTWRQRRESVGER